MELDVFVIGGVGVDTVVRVPALPLPAVETIHVDPVESYVGHTGHGVALGCHLLGLRAGLADVIGDDAEGYRIRRLYDDLRMPLHVALHPSGTRRSVNLVTPDGGRLALYDARHPAGLRVDPDLWRTNVAHATHVHVSIMDFARDALSDALAADCTISTDLHDWDGRNDYHKDFATAADIVFVSTSALRADAVDWIFANGRAEVVVAMSGADGSYLHVRDRAPLHIPAVDLPDRPVVDTNGAGDAYVAAFLARRLDGVGWYDAALAGSIAGAWACGSPGTHTDLITAEELAVRSRALG
ncbi:carbohydrate kinase family protein [Kribbella turkmenica]|uniref:Carbohydrate kinase family protein n=1 Tax=Kribbella turkmenica TaxID=2530375 RepID=A0A4R4XAJ2_9ACTN|nr:carbohydrate kinase family protein [Kribbella turkmenica]TDD27505.1 carbohydrate kinase family protein [Kribbella turkmenica]